MTKQFYELDLEDRMKADGTVKFSNLILRTSVNRAVNELFLEYNVDEKYAKLYSENNESGEEENLFPNGEPLFDAFRRTSLTEAAVARFKHLAEVDPFEKNVSQIGMFSFAYSKNQMRYDPLSPEVRGPDPFYRADVQVETIPTESGEKVKLLFTLTDEEYNPIQKFAMTK
jgi:hypothetical protein